MKSFVVDFNNNIGGRENIDSLKLQVSEKKILFGLIKQEVNVNYYSVKIGNIKIDDDVVIDDIQKLITLNINNPTQKISSNELLNINIGVNEFEIQIELDKLQITDFLSENEYSKIISFDILAKPNFDSVEIIKNYSFEIVFIRANSEIRIEFKRENTFDFGLEHRKESDILLGNLEITCEADHNFAFPIENCILSIINNKEIGESVCFSDHDKIKSIDFLYGNEKNLFIVQNSSSLQFNKIEPRTKIIIPVLLNLNRLENPDEFKNFKGKYSVVYQKQGSEAIKSYDFDFNILPDTRSTALLVMIDDGSAFKRIDSNVVFLNNKYQWLGNDAKGKSTCFTFKVGNNAENGIGKVEIKDLAFDFKHAKNSTSPLITSGFDKTNNKDASLFDKCLDDIFTINNSKKRTVQSEYVFENSIKSFEVFEVGFRFDSIVDIPDDIAEIECDLSFNYTITDKGSKSEILNFETKIVFKVEKNPGDHWLAIDYGTSAIVTAFADGDALARRKIDDLILDLQETLNILNPSNNDGMSEKGTKFLSSEMLIRDTKRERPVYIESSNYFDDIVHLSPSKDELAQYSHLSVPYLKSLIGGEVIPDFSGKLQDITYAEKADSPILSFKVHPLKIENVLSNTYNIIVRDFVEKKVSEHKKLNKVILTIPNTFTPKHIETIKKVFLNKFKNFKVDYIDFISESDAVACHYVSNWDVMNTNRIDNSSILNNDEYVLVYDIGAGTTDLTYLRIGKNTNGEKELTIIGKFGKTTAGNYLDYTVASILEIFTNLNFTTINAANIHTARQIKFAIKDFIKPNLGENISFEIDDTGTLNQNVNNGREISMNDIVEHEFMNRYVRENSTDLFDKFFGLFNKLEVGSTETFSKGEFPLDTVIFTGRAAQFGKLRQAVEEELISWTNNPEQIHYINNLDSNALKNTVVLGALQYAMVYRDQHNSPVKITNRNIYARYGFLYKDFETGRWIFKELLNPATKPLNPIPHKIDGVTIYEYDSSVYNALGHGDSATIDLRNSPAGYFVQSFSSNTAQDVNEQNWQYVTVMFNFNRNSVCSGGNSAYVPVRILVNAKNEMIVKVGSYENDPQAPLKIDLVENETFRKSMWPFIV